MLGITFVEVDTCWKLKGLMLAMFRCRKSSSNTAVNRISGCNLPPAINICYSTDMLLIKHFPFANRSYGSFTKLWKALVSVYIKTIASDSGWFHKSSIVILKTAPRQEVIVFHPNLNTTQTSLPAEAVTCCKSNHQAWEASGRNVF